MAAREPQFAEICHNGDQLIANKHKDSRDLKKRIQNLKDRWQKLRDLAKQRKTRLEDASESHQVLLMSRVYRHRGVRCVVDFT